MPSTIDLEKFRQLLTQVMNHDPDDPTLVTLCGGGKKYGEAHLAEVTLRQGQPVQSEGDGQRCFSGHRPVPERAIRTKTRHP